jgi:hypothetical protein
MNGEQNKRGRKALPASEVVDVRVNDEAVARAGAAATELVLHDEQVETNVRAVAHRLHYDGPVHPDLLEQGIRSELRRGVEACLNIGAMLVLIREQCPRGEFTDRLARLGIEVTLAQRFMQASIKLASTSPKLLQAIGNQSKLFELLVLDTEEIMELSDGGSVRGISVDTIAAMGVVEMRTKIRDQGDKLKAKDKVIRDKEAKISEQEEELALLSSAKPDEREKEQLKLLGETMLHADNAVASAVGVALGIFEKPATGRAELAARQSIELLMRTLVDICLKRNLEIDLAAEVDPFWWAAIKEMRAKGASYDEQQRAGRAAKRRLRGEGGDEV